MSSHTRLIGSISQRC